MLAITKAALAQVHGVDTIKRGFSDYSIAWPPHWTP